MVYEHGVEQYCLYAVAGLRVQERQLRLRELSGYREAQTLFPNLFSAAG